METNNILEKIKAAGLVGRGGAEFPTALKWEMVKKAKGEKKYVICNASEGELGLFKDLFILKNHTEQVFEGMIIAMDFLETKEAYFNINRDYYEELRESIDGLIGKYAKDGYRFTVFQEHPSYAGGEETVLLNAIEGKRIQPRLKPPYPSDAGLYGMPTLIHNVETLYNVTDVRNGKFEDRRFYCISGPVDHEGVYHLPASFTIQKVLKETKNIPDFPFFAQIGGSASGVVYNKDQLGDHKVSGAGSIEIYREDILPKEILMKWFTFYMNESCGKCTPCREGSYQLHHMTKDAKEIPWDGIFEIVEAMEETSFCALGKSVGIPVRSYFENVLHMKP